MFETNTACTASTRITGLATPANNAVSPAILPGDLGEHLFLLARWYYSNPRDGEIFFHEKDWPYRRILRACSRLLNPKSADAAGKPGTTTNRQQGTSDIEKGAEKGT